MAELNRPHAAPLAEPIRALRERLGLTQRDFASRLSVPQSTVYRWEVGRSSPRGESLARLQDLAHAHGLSLDLPAAAPAPGEGIRSPILEATLALLRQEFAFCVALEEGKDDPQLGVLAWQVLGDALSAHRRRVSDFLVEAEKLPPERFPFWKAMDLMKVLAWRGPVSPMAMMARGYVTPGQLAPEPRRD